MSQSVTVPRRFNGPLDSGNGGYSSGVFAGILEGPAEVHLRSPVPLDTELDVTRGADGSVRMFDGDALVAEARSVPGFDLDVPEAPSSEEAHAATARYRGSSEGIFRRCFVCGPAREDAFGVFAGAVEGRELVASPWTPPGWTADAAGQVRPEFVWAVLDCPTYFALYTEGELPVSMLARFTARIDAPVTAGEEHIVIAWPIEIDGRKHLAGSAVLSADGRTLAGAQALLIQLREG